MIICKLPANELKARFTVGIVDEVTNLSLPKTEPLDLTPDSTFQARFWGFGSDGTVGANKQAIKIIGDHTDKYAQAYFDYDSKKSGGLTVSHLRFGKEKIDSTYLVEKPDFVGCHNAAYIYKLDLVKGLRDGGTFLLNTVWNEEQVHKHLPINLKRYLAKHHNKFYIINAMDIAKATGLGRRINTVMSAAFFEVTDIMDRKEFLPLLKDEIDKTYGKKSQEIVEKNWQAIDQTFENLHEITVPKEWAELEEVPSRSSNEEKRPDFVRNIVDPIARKEGDSLTVGNLIDNGMYDGRLPMGTAAYEKRGIALEVPEWIPEKCTLCNECAFVCPHAVPFVLSS